MLPNENLLSKQTIKGNKKFSDGDLKLLFRQKSNRSFLGIKVYLNAYYLGRKYYDTAVINQGKKEIIAKYNLKLIALNDTLYVKSLVANEFPEPAADSIHKNNPDFKKILRTRKHREKKISKANLRLTKGNWMMRVIGEPPSIYDTNATAENKKYLESYYHNNGYFDCIVNSKIDTVRKMVNETYLINENKVYTINKLRLYCRDTALFNIVTQNNKESLLKEKAVYKEQNLTAERDRLNRLFKNSGYFDFTPQYISFEIDSSKSQQSLEVDIVIASPNKTEGHKRYTIDKIYYFTDIDLQKNMLDTMEFRKIHFVYTRENFSKRIVSKKMQIKAGEYYSQSKIQNTQRQLAALDMYKFININFEKIASKDSAHNGLIANLRTSSLKKFQSTEEVGLSMASNFIPGPSGMLNFKSRNTFRGFEIYEANLRATVVGQASLLNASEFYKSEEYSAQNSLSFPQLYFPLSRKLQNYIENFSPVTRFSASYTYIGRPEYTRDNINLSMIYHFLFSTKKQFSFSIVDANLVATKNKSPDFEAYLGTLQSNGNNLINSFGTTIVTGINSTYTFTDNTIGENKKSKFFRLYAESGGTMLNILNSTQILQSSDTLFGLKTFRYYKFNADFRFYLPIRKNTFAMRYNIGVAKAYDKEEVLPYERNFFLGGSNSIRAWAPRRLGPGAWVAERDANGRAVYRFEQPGSILLEMSWEYRFKVIKFLESAVFIDAGNLWIWAPRSGAEKARPEGVFYVDKFLSQIAVGTGLGIRLNFSFLILRFDFGLKAKDPSQPEGKRWIFLQEGYRTPNVNLSIGYPF